MNPLSEPTTGALTLFLLALSPCAMLLLHSALRSALKAMGMKEQRKQPDFVWKVGTLLICFFGMVPRYVNNFSGDWLSLTMHPWEWQALWSTLFTLVIWSLIWQFMTLRESGAHAS